MLANQGKLQVIDFEFAGKGKKTAYPSNLSGAFSLIATGLDLIELKHDQQLVQKLYDMIY